MRFAFSVQVVNEARRQLDLFLRGKTILLSMI